MKKNFLLISSILLTLIAFSAQAWSTPIVNTASDGFEDNADGTVFDYYQNSGTLVGVWSGNETLADIEAHLNDWWTGEGDIILSTDSLTLSVTGWNGTTDDTIIDAEPEEPFKVDFPASPEYLSGTWEAFDSGTDPLEPAEISVYAVKGSTAYAIYWLDPADYDGSWSMYDINASGLTPGEGVKSISHLTGAFANIDDNGPDPAEIPEPATFMLFGVGLLGLANIARKKK